MAQSILTSVKHMLGLAADYTVFDVDVIIHTNSAFAVLSQLGLGPPDGFTIVDDTETWEDYIGSTKFIEMVRTYVYLYVRLIFDPPTTSFAISAFQKQLDELAWRLNVVREDEQWVDPTPIPEPVEL
jgi:hypothetical protein